MDSYIPVNIAGAPYARENSSGTDDSRLLKSLVFNMNQKFVLRQEADEKYLDKTEGDKFYLNEPITENIDIKNKKIINSGSPEDLGDLVNKQYVDNKFIEKETLVRFQNSNEKTYAKKTDIKHFAKKTDIRGHQYPFQNSKLESMLIYYNIAMEYNPRVWISTKFPVGLFPKLNKVDIYMGSPTANMFADIMGNKVDVEGVKGQLPPKISITKFLMMVKLYFY